MMVWLFILCFFGLTCWALFVADQLGLIRSRDWGNREAAERKGLDLLLENLTESQRAQYRQFGYFDVVGSESGNPYRICHGTSRNVSELLDKNRLGTGRCFAPRGNLVAGDCMLSQKVALENFESETLKIAVRF
jgi:hypothetical protein